MVATIKRQQISIHGGFKPGEKVIERLDISVRLPRSRKVQRRVLFSLPVFFFCIFLAAAQFPLLMVGLEGMLVTWIILWFVFNGSIKLVFPHPEELVVTNQRLLLRSGARFRVWVSNYDSEIEVFVREEFATFVVRPNIDSCSPREVFVKSVSPFQQGKHLAALLRSLREAQLLAADSSIDSPANSIASGAKVYSSLPLSLSANLSPVLAPHAPPGIAVTHAFLSHQLRLLIASIAVVPALSAISAISVNPAIKALSVSANAFQNTDSPHNSDSSQNSDAKRNTDRPNQLGDTGYQFGVDQQP